MLRRDTITVTGTAGAVVDYIPAAGTQTLSGRLVNILYTKVDFADGVDFAIVSERTGQSLWTEENVNASKTVAPLQAAIGTDGVALAGVYAPIVLCEDRVKLTITAGGATKTGTFTVIMA